MHFIEKMRRWDIPYDPDFTTDLDELYEMLEQHCNEARQADQRHYQWLLDGGYSDQELVAKAKQRERHQTPDPFVTKIVAQIRGVKIAAGVLCGYCYLEVAQCECRKEPMTDEDREAIERQYSPKYSNQHKTITKDQE